MYYEWFKEHVFTSGRAERFLKRHGFALHLDSDRPEHGCTEEFMQKCVHKPFFRSYEHVPNIFVHVRPFDTFNDSQLTLRLGTPASQRQRQGGADEATKSNSDQGNDDRNVDQSLTVNETVLHIRFVQCDPANASSSTEIYTKNAAKRLRFAYVPDEDAHLLAHDYVPDDKRMRKYWMQRRRLFSRFYDGVLMDKG
jgi:hypothetical protein